MLRYLRDQRQREPVLPVADLDRFDILSRAIALALLYPCRQVGFDERILGLPSAIIPDHEAVEAQP